MNAKDSVKINKQEIEFMKIEKETYASLIKDIRKGTIYENQKSLIVDFDDYLSDPAAKKESFKENLVKIGLLELGSILDQASTGMEMLQALRVIDLCRVLLEENKLPKKSLSPISRQLDFDYVNRRIDLMTYKNYCQEQYKTLWNLLKKYN